MSREEKQIVNKGRVTNDRLCCERRPVGQPAAGVRTIVFKLANPSWPVCIVTGDC